MKLVLAVLFAICCDNAAAVTVGEWAPGFEAPLLLGEGSVKLTDSHGKVVYLDFWASWCTSCRAALSALEQLRFEFGGAGFEVIGVNVDEDPAAALKVLRSVSLNFPLVRDAHGELAKLYDLPAMPSGYLIGRDGAVVAIRKGFREDEVPALRAAVADLVKQK
jgi:thiol-disulfide isomerase/thioredoxin